MKHTPKMAKVVRSVLFPLCALSVILSAVNVAFATDPWKTLAPMPTARSFAQVQAINGILYVAGGRNASGDVPTLEAYNPATNTWTIPPLQPMPDIGDGNPGRYQGAVAVVNGTLVVIGGWHTSPPLPTSTPKVYDPGTKNWGTLAEMPTRSGCGAAGVIGGKVYVNTPCNGFSGWRQFLHVYDSATQGWDQLPDSPAVHSGPVGAGINGKFYLAGGHDGVAVAGTGRLDVYDPITKIWANPPPTPAPISIYNAAGGVLKGTLYVAGGYDGVAHSNVLQAYDTEKDTWTTLPSMNTARSGAGGAVIDGKFYVVGGDNGAPLGTLEVFTPVSDCQVSVNPVRQCHGKNPSPPPPGHWGGEQYAFHVGKTICGLGCYLTSLSLALQSAGVTNIPSCTNINTLSNDPGTLNDFMKCDPLLNRYDGQNNVNPGVTVSALNVKLRSMGLLTKQTNLAFITPDTELSSSVDDAAARKTLDDALCAQKSAVIVQVKHCVTKTDGTINCGDHFPLVYGIDGTDYLIADPAGAQAGSEAPLHKHLSDYLNDPLAVKNGYKTFTVKGYVQDPPNAGLLNISIGDTADLLVTDSSGKRTGFLSGSDIREIPHSVHSVVSLIDDTTGEIPDGTSHTVSIRDPLQGNYNVNVSGLKRGLYNLSIIAFSQDGSPQPLVVIAGIADVSSSDSFKITYSTSAGGSVSIKKQVTFDSLRREVQNLAAAGFIGDQRLTGKLDAVLAYGQNALVRGKDEHVFEALARFSRMIHFANQGETVERDDDDKHSKRFITTPALEILTADGKILLDTIPSRRGVGLERDR